MNYCMRTQLSKMNSPCRVFVTVAYVCALVGPDRSVGRSIDRSVGLFGHLEKGPYYLAPGIVRNSQSRVTTCGPSDCA